MLFFASVPYLSGVTSFDRPDGIAWTLAATDNLTFAAGHQQISDGRGVTKRRSWSRTASCGQWVLAQPATICIRSKTD